MKAKACTRCRQTKLRCDSDVRSPGPCSRCLSIGRPCLVETASRAASKRRRLQDLEQEVQRLRQAQTQAQQPYVGAGSTTSSPPAPGRQVPLLEPPLPPRTLLTQEDALPLSRPGLINGSVPANSADKCIGNVRLAREQVTELFAVYFAQRHPYLDFSMPTSPEAIHERCPLLFWTICAVASTTNTMLELQPEIHSMLGQIICNPPRSIEVVQALLILCIWPFPFHTTLGDPSLIYCGVATQIGFQIGLHRPSLSQEFSSRKQVVDVGYDERKTTWMACYVVNQMQAARLGVPLTIPADFTFLRALETANLSQNLVALCRISRITVQFTTTIGANGQNLSGLLDSGARLDLVKFFNSELDTLQRTYFPEMSEIVKIAYLTSRLQLHSFLLLDDAPYPYDAIELIYMAENDAFALIRLASERNLSMCPFHLARSVLYSGLILLKILNSPYAKRTSAILDQIQLASRTLSSAVKVPNDNAELWSKHLNDLPKIQDKRHTPQIRSRMAASLIYDTIRVLKEHRMEASLHGVPPTLDVGLESQPNWIDVPMAAGEIDLDGLNWDDIGELL